LEFHVSVISSQRSLFAIPDEIAYFNTAYNAPQLNESLNRLLVGVRAKSRPWERTPASFFEDAETVRRLSAKIFGGDAEGYAVIPAASYGISTAARAVEPFMKPSDRVLVIAEEFPSNVLPWRRTAQVTGATLHTVASPQYGDWTRAVLDHIDPSVKVVAISTCHWTNGASIDLRPVARACRDAGCVLVVDATQSLGAMPFPLEEVQPDFLVAAGYKWLLCPYGFGLLYVSQRWRGARPLEESWLARDNAHDFAALVNYSDTYQHGARRFDAGEKCNPAVLPGAIAALEQIDAWGIEAISHSLSVINAEIAGHLMSMGFEVPEEAARCAHMFGARLPRGKASDLVAELRKHGVYVSQRGNAIRFAPHLHVTENDVARLVDALHLWMERAS
jgi:selenocysteine lyase/cysteine desulfurase